MLPAEIYEVEFFDAEAVEARRLPARVAPLPDEALPSWLLRFANPFGVSPEALLLGDGEADLDSQHCRPSQASCCRLEASGLPPPTHRRALQCMESMNPY